MHFWIMVGVAYSLILAAGLSIGMELSKKHPRNGGGSQPPVAPIPAGPTFGMDVSPLGSDYDRMLLPDAFPVDENARHG